MLFNDAASAGGLYNVDTIVLVKIIFHHVLCPTETCPQQNVHCQTQNHFPLCLLLPMEQLVKKFVGIWLFQRTGCFLLLLKNVRVKVNERYLRSRGKYNLHTMNA
jgi:hypothetical protein